MRTAKTLIWLHRSFCWFCHVEAHILVVPEKACLVSWLKKKKKYSNLKFPYFCGGYERIMRYNTPCHVLIQIYMCSTCRHKTAFVISGVVYFKKKKRTNKQGIEFVMSLSIVYVTTNTPTRQAV